LKAGLIETVLGLEHDGELVAGRRHKPRCCLLVLAGLHCDAPNVRGKPALLRAIVPCADHERQEIILATKTIAKATLQQRAMHELKEFAILFVYLYITLGAVVLLKTAVLHTQGIDAVVWGVTVVKAAVLAKFMMLGYVMKIGEHNTTRPLIWPTLHRAFGFLVLLIVMTVIEEIVVGLFHRQSMASSLAALAGPRLEETLAGYLVMLLVLVPFFAFRVLGDALGEGRLMRMFFVRREPILTPPGSGADVPHIS
jgi:hypothetical protein